jgi:ribonuclease VapC
LILDTSVLVTIVLEEPGHELLSKTIADARTALVGAPTAVAAGIVLSGRLGEAGPELLANALTSLDATVVEFGADHWREAISAWLRFGKGRHPARLNFGDCLTYAVARIAGQPLLATGSDFELTDLALA